MRTEIILASASPRREQLLSQIGCHFRVIPSQVEEDNASDLAPAELAVAHAAAKARDVSLMTEAGDIVIGADTVVALDGRLFGKPRDVADARRMLGLLSGRTHTVYTGIAVAQNGSLLTDCAATDVCFRRLTLAEIKRYVATGEPLDKAGAYAVQGLGALLVDRIDGCYSNVVGLPLVALARLLSKAGVKLL